MKRPQKINPGPLQVDWMPEGFSNEKLLALPKEMIWTVEMVQQRLVEAAVVAERTIRRPAPSQRASSWPEWLYDIDDLMGQDAADKHPTAYIPRFQIDRAEQAMYWPSQYLREEPGAGRVLRAFIRAKAFKVPFSKVVRSRGWSRATAYRSRDRALSIIAMCLMRDGVEPA